MITTIEIPDGVTSISNDLFDYCTSLESITFPDNVTSIGSYAFYNCSSLKSITIPDGVTSIGPSAFQACSNLTSITIPDSVTSIGEDAFRGCSNLVIYGYSGSAAQQYAEANNIPFKIFIGSASVTIPVQDYTYTGDPLEPEVTVILNGAQLIEDTDYEVTYSGNIAASMINVRWTTTARATGYQIKYSTSKTFASDNGTVSAYGGTTASRRIENLTRGKIYYVKIRAYKVVGNGLYWSEWSPARTVRISK